MRRANVVSAKWPSKILCLEILSTNFVNGKHLPCIFPICILSISREANSPFIVDFVFVVARIVLV